MAELTRRRFIELSAAAAAGAVSQLVLPRFAFADSEQANQGLEGVLEQATANQHPENGKPAGILETLASKNYTVHLEPGDTVYRAALRAFDKEQTPAYFASLQIIEPVNPGNYTINGQRLAKDLQIAGFNEQLRTNPAYQEYVFDWHHFSSRKNERIEHAVNRLTGYDGKKLYFALEEVRERFGSLNPGPGNYIIYFNEEQLQGKLDQHYARVFGVSVEHIRENRWMYEKPASVRSVVRSRMTGYFTPYLAEYSSQGEFWSEVNMQGSGIVWTDESGRSLIARYYGGTFLAQPGVIGITASGKNPIPIGTLAGDPRVPFGKRIWLEFGEVNPLNGWYVVQDRGSAIMDRSGGGYGRYDLFAGLGFKALNMVRRFMTSVAVAYIP